MNADEVIKKLRSRDRFVFAYHFTAEDHELPLEYLRAKLKIHLEKTMDAYFQDRPSVAKYHNEPLRY